MKKINKEDWFKEGMTILGRDGFSKITIDNLCAVLKVTKGSFYHHFGNMEGYIKALMEYWLQTNTYDFISEAEKQNNTTQKQVFLYQKAMNAEYTYEQNIRAWGYSNPLIMGYVKKSDQIRLDYLIDLKIKFGEKPDAAQRAAMLDMAILVGMQQLYPNISKTDLNKIFLERQIIN